MGHRRHERGALRLAGTQRGQLAFRVELVGDHGQGHGRVTDERPRQSDAGQGRFVRVGEDESEGHVARCRHYHLGVAGSVQRPSVPTGMRPDGDRHGCGDRRGALGRAPRRGIVQPRSQGERLGWIFVRRDADGHPSRCLIRQDGRVPGAHGPGQELEQVREASLGADVPGQDVHGASQQERFVSGGRSSARREASRRSSSGGGAWSSGASSGR